MVEGTFFRQELRQTFEHDFPIVQGKTIPAYVVYEGMASIYHPTSIGISLDLVKLFETFWYLVEASNSAEAEKSHFGRSLSIGDDYVSSQACSQGRVNH